MKQNPAPTDALPYQPEEIEAKWQRRWAEQHVNEPDLDGAPRPFYNLMMFPYPSAEGLHVGNMFAFTGSDVYGRFKRLQGYDVFEPIGFDAFGIHSENYAIKVGINPAELIPRNIENFRRQLRRIGGMFDWRHELSTTDPKYYKWTQWIFLQLLKAGKAYKKAAAVNWCPKDMTVLANEQVIDGRCERCDSLVEQRTLSQWFFRITEYSDRLLTDLDDKEKMDWSDSTTTAQRNWLGRSEGAEIVFSGAAGQRGSGDKQKSLRGGGASEAIPSLRTGSGYSRPALTRIFGATFMVLAPEHPLVDAFTSAEQRETVDAYRKAAASQDLVSRKVGEREKTGVFTGGYATNPATGKQIPVWIADYVLMEYGTGAIMAVPGHDERDFEFAQEIRPADRSRRCAPSIASLLASPISSASERIGPLVRSTADAGLHRQRERHPRQLGPLRRPQRPRRQTRHHLMARRARRRQGRHQLPAARLVHLAPALLGPAHSYHLLRRARRRTRAGEGPPGRAPDHRGLPSRRHRRLSARAARELVSRPLSGLRQAGPSRDRRERHLPRLGLVPSALSQHRVRRSAVRSGAHPEVAPGKHLHRRQRARGAAPAVCALHHHGAARAGARPFRRAVQKFRAHGLIVKDGAKMSKSRGNVVIPDEYIAKWGADTFRMYLMFLGPFQEGGDFRDEGISGPRRFLEKVWRIVTEATSGGGEDLRLATRDSPPATGDSRLTIKYHQTVKRVSEGMEQLHYNTSIAALMEFVNTLRTEGSTHREMVEGLVLMLAPFAPHFAEESWERLGHDGSIFDARWPGWDERLTVEDSVEIAVQVNGKTRSKVSVLRDAEQGIVVAAAQEDAAVRRFTEGKEVRKVVYVPNRLLNLVVG